MRRFQSRHRERRICVGFNLKARPKETPSTEKHLSITALTVKQIESPIIIFFFLFSFAYIERKE